MKQRIFTGAGLGLGFALLYFALPIPIYRSAVYASWHHLSPETLALLPAVLAFGILAALGARELLVTTGALKKHPLVGLTMAAAFLMSPITAFGGSWHLLALCFVFMVAAFACAVFDHTQVSFAALSKAFMAALVLPLMLTSVVRVFDQAHDIFGGFTLQAGLLALLSWFTVWVCDSAALFVGRAFGKRKLAPYVSPKKTVAGFVGGMAGGFLVTVVYLLAFGDILYHQWPHSWNVLLLFGVLAPALGQLGDLSLSVIKRETGIKDYGKLFPGHGGVYDRFDSILFVAPLFEIILRIFGY